MAAGSLARRLLDSLRSRHASDVENDGLAGASVLVLHASDAVLFTLLGYVALVILPRRLWRLVSSWRWPGGQGDKAD